MTLTNGSVLILKEAFRQGRRCRDISWLHMSLSFETAPSSFKIVVVILVGKTSKSVELRE